MPHHRRNGGVAAIEELDVACYRIPTDAPESDGTFEWDHTVVVIVHARADGGAGVGWTFGPAAAGQIVRDALSKAIVGRSAMAIEGAWQAMVDSVRNDGRPGICSMAISAVDVALWDLKAKLLGLALVDLFGTVRSAVDVYGSGGFTSYSDDRLAEQLGGWVKSGIPRVKMKIGRDAEADLRRVRVAREAIGDDAELFVDANGAYGRKQALAMSQSFRDDAGVSWFEEPRPSDDLEGLRLLRDRGPAGMDIAAGEYGDTPGYFRRMLDAAAVDCLQADATRCGGFTGFLKVAALCEAHQMPLSAHCAPQLHAHVGCAVRPLRHVEYFHDHVRLGQIIFDGMLSPVDGTLRPDRTRVGHGVGLRTADAERFKI